MFVEPALGERLHRASAEVHHKQTYERDGWPMSHRAAHEKQRARAGDERGEPRATVSRLDSVAHHRLGADHPRDRQLAVKPPDDPDSNTVALAARLRPFH